MMRGLCVLTVVSVHLMNAVWNAGVMDFTGFIPGTIFLPAGYFMKGTPPGAQLKKRISGLAKPFVICFAVFAVTGGILLMRAAGMTFAEWGRSAVSELPGKPLPDLIAPGFYPDTALHRPLTVMWFFIQLIPATLIVVPVLNLCGGSLKRKGIRFDRRRGTYRTDAAVPAQTPFVRLFRRRRGLFSKER